MGEGAEIRRAFTRKVANGLGLEPSVKIHQEFGSVAKACALAGWENRELSRRVEGSVSLDFREGGRKWREMKGKKGAAVGEGEASPVYQKGSSDFALLPFPSVAASLPSKLQMLVGGFLII